jgi:hypothetical protein
MGIGRLPSPTARRLQSPLMPITPDSQFPRDEHQPPMGIDWPWLTGVAVIVLLLIFFKRRKAGLPSIAIPPAPPPLVSPWNPLP